MQEENKRVVACVDGSGLSDAVTDYASWIAASIDKPLCLLNTVDHHHERAKSDLTGNIALGTKEELLETLSSEEREASKARIALGREALESAKTRAERAGATPRLSQRHGPLYENVKEVEEEVRVLVLGVRGTDGTTVGKQVEEVIRSLHTAILLVGDSFRQPEKIMLAYDGSTSADKALEMIAQAPLFKQLECHVVHVGKKPEASEVLLAKAESELKAAGVNVVTSALEGVPMAALLNYQKEHGIGMIAMGAFSHNRLRDALFGSFTAKMIASSPVPLLLLR